MQYEGVSLVSNQIETFNVKDIISHYISDDVIYISGGTPLIASSVKPSGFDVDAAISTLKVFEKFEEAEGAKENLQALINWLQAKI